MKKKIVTLIILAVLTSLGIVVILNNKNKTYEIKGTNNGQFAFYYEDENGEYQKSTDSKWDSGEYVLNIANSSCDGENNPEFLSWNEDNNSVLLTRNKATKCSLYFDKKLPSIFDSCPGATNLVECITQIDGGKTGEEDFTSDLCPNGIGTVYKHDGSDPNDAGDNGFRYSGCNPNNYICFGEGSEDYNKGKTDVCPIKNKYRIIGIVPVSVGDTTQNLVKVIKAEYLTEEEFGNVDGEVGTYIESTDLKRVESSLNDVPGYKRNDENKNTWDDSYLNIGLNSENFINNIFGNNWKNKIETVTWNVGGISTNELTPKLLLTEANKQENTSQARIGLMYIHDYGFASSSNNWQYTLSSYNNTNNNNRENNWLYNAIYEWTISNKLSSSSYAFYVVATGSVNFWNSNSTLAVRPVFYLTSDTNIIGDFRANGSVDHPFKIELNQLDVLLDTDVGEEGEFLQHTTELDYSAEDNGYRYSGNQPNNYICFGNGSEDYNKGKTNVCDIKNKYRIIGYVPVTLDDSGKQEFRTKVIKAEYLTDEEFEHQDGIVSFKSDYEQLKRVETTASTFSGYYWNNTQSDTWKQSSLYNSLNSDYYRNKIFGNDWQNAIEIVTWNIGGNATQNITAKNMYEAEIFGQGATTKVSAAIGLMYVHDYGFASNHNNWNFTLDKYNDNGNTNRENNWLFNGATEWTISCHSAIPNYVFSLISSGVIGHDNTSGFAYGVRPVFYFKKDVKLISDETHNGTKSNPLKVKV